MSEDQEQEQAKWSIAEWHGKMLIDRDGEKIGKLQDVYVDVERTNRSSQPLRRASSAVT